MKKNRPFERSKSRPLERGKSRPLERGKNRPFERNKKGYVRPPETGLGRGCILVLKHNSG